jgi:hypothetical protein
MQQAGSQHRVAKNAMWIIGGRVIQALLGLVVGALTARYLGPSSFGSINYAASLTAFIAPVLYLGLNATLVHELVTRERHEGTVLGTSLLLGLVASAVCFLGVCAFAFFVNATEQEIVLVCCLYAAGMLFQADGEQLHIAFGAQNMIARLQVANLGQMGQCPDGDQLGLIVLRHAASHLGFAKGLLIVQPNPRLLGLQLDF